MGFMYYFPGKQSMTPDQLPPECELDHLKDVQGFEIRTVENHGPDEGAGVLFAPIPAPEKFGYYKNEQAWQPVQNSKGVVTHWLGISLNDKPRSDHLQRFGYIEGELVTFANQEQWFIPVIEAYVPIPEADGKSGFESQIWHVTLPKTMEATYDWKTQIAVVPQYSELVAQGAIWRDVYWESKPYRNIDFWRFVAGLLAVNYRVGRAEINMLGLLNDHPRMHTAVLEAALGIVAMTREIEAQKKTDIRDDTLSSLGGEAA